MGEIDQALLDTIGERLSSATHELIVQARQIFEEVASSVDVDALRCRELAALQLEQARLTEAAAASRPTRGL
jgi:hypothetical protein